MKIQPAFSLAPDKFTMEFLMNQAGPSSAIPPSSLRDPFHMSSLNKELEAMGPPVMMESGDWTVDYLKTDNHLLTHHSFEEFEEAFKAAQGQNSINWTQEFAQFQNSSQNHGIHDFGAEEFEKAFEEAKRDVSWAGEFASSEPSWAEEFVETEKNIDISGLNSNEALARTAGILLDVVESSTNPKFKNSKFLGFMKQLKHKEVEIQGNEVVPVEEIKTDWAAEYSNTAAKGSVQQWEDEFMEMEADDILAPSKVEEDIWANQFFQSEEQRVAQSDWTDEFAGEFAGTETDESALWESLKDKWDEVNDNSIRSTDPRFENYEFAAENPYLNQPLEFLENQNGHRNLTESILALEAAVQLNPHNAANWHALGIKQQENENEASAIAALRKAVSGNPGNLDSWLALAVSYTNENYRAEAFDSLEAWLANSEKYKFVLGRNERSPGQERLQHIISLFLEAARQNPGEDLDEDVQAALGVVFNISQEYEKAVDCFEVALTKRPQDYLLWNKLGATLANSNNIPRAIDSYFNALEINPNYVRARYNLAIACIQMNQYREAAEHLLGALNVHSSGNNQMSKLEPNVNVMSTSVWNTLLQVVEGHLNRPDLAEFCYKQDLNAFR
ncbi:hypothetical protein HK096_004692, partial [Nowakowskiella sp. JEL0078]